MKKVWSFIIIVLLGIAIIGSYAVFTNFCPKADPISCPDTENITTFSLVKNNDTSITVESAHFRNFLQYISNAKPTRRMSLNDYPSAETYYTIKVDTPMRKYYYFVYKENSQVYIELPYEGIYKSNQQFFDFVEDYYKN